MKIYALFGPSGTGKSTNALALAHKYHINAIIDDGLLIYKGKKVAGKSAKYEKTTVQAVKRAIFLWNEHAEEVKHALHRYPIERILLLGTSRKMVDRIQGALDLPKIDHYINITEIRSSSEIKAALYERGMQGRHVIPIPRVQVEQDFIYRLIAQVDKIFSPKKEELGETTIVHPQFQTGKIHVSEHALKKLVINSCKQVSAVTEIKKVKVDFGKTPVVEVALKLTMGLEENIQCLATQVQEEIYYSFYNYLELELEKIEMHITQVEVRPTKEEPNPE